MSESVKFAVGGPVQVKQGTYLRRPADEELFKACMAGEFSYVLACRQIGKTSLMNETAERLRQEGVRTALIDLNWIGKTRDADKWYFSLIAKLADDLKLKADIEEWWDKNPALSTSPQRFGQFLRHVVLQEIEEAVVIFIDEIDMTLGLDFTDDFFAAIRTIYNDRAQHQAYRRLTFVLLGVATPDELIKDSTRTPFNIGYPITLRDFTRVQCHPFRIEIENRYPNLGKQYFEQIYSWSYGHPYLTQKLCQVILNEGVDNDPRLVERLVEKLFLMPAERGDDNLQFVQDRVRNDAHAEVMLKKYKQVLLGEKDVYDDESTAINRLKLYGLIVVVKHGKLKVRNNLYTHFFNREWVDEMSRSIRLGIPNHYTILQKIGQPGFATVYLAQTTQNSHEIQTVALKVIDLREISDADWSRWLAWLKQEVRAIAGLNHPNIIDVIEADYNDREKTIFVAMKYIAGGNLREKLKVGPLHSREAIEIIKGVGAALAFAHKQNIFHLGVYPNDILLDINPNRVQPVLTDFGFAKLFPKDDETQTHSKPTRLVYQYLAPELWQQQPPSPATDVYSLAVTFFEMLAGQLPPNRKPGDPLPALSQVAPDLGELFDEVLVKATAQLPADRYLGIDDFIQALETAPQAEAAKLLGIAQAYTKVGHYDPEIALAMLEDVFEIYPNYPGALRLRGQIRLKQAHFSEALTDYKCAHEQSSEHHPLAETTRDYVLALAYVANAFWEQQNRLEAVKYFEEIRQMLAGIEYENVDIQNIQQQAHTRLVEYYYDAGKQAYDIRNSDPVAETTQILNSKIEALEGLSAFPEAQDLREKLKRLGIEHHHKAGVMAYADGNPKDINKAIEILIDEITALEELGATPECQSLQEKLRLLHVKHYQDIVQRQQAIIDDLNSHNDENVFRHYVEIDEIYQKLIELEPENQEWPAQRRENLLRKAERRQQFAVKAEQELDFEAAMRHYLAIRNIEETRCKGIASVLALDLNEKLAELEKNIGYDHKYREINKLVEQGKHLNAFNQLVQDFISVGNYEHRGVARLFWGLVYAKRNKGNFPPEWNLPEAEQELTRVRADLTEAQVKLAEAERESVHIREESTTLQNKLAQREQDLNQAKIELNSTQAELTQAHQEHHSLQADLVRAKDGEMHTFKKLNRSYEINRYLTPISLLAAVAAGGIIAPQLWQSSGSTLFIITGVALVILIGHFIYYIWTYYWPPSSK